MGISIFFREANEDAADFIIHFCTGGYCPEKQKDLTTVKELIECVKQERNRVQRARLLKDAVR